MAKMLVTGGAGAIGYHLSKALAELGHDVVIVDNFSRSRSDLLFDNLISLDNVRFLNIDLCDASAVSSLDVDFDYVFHLAAMNGTQNFYDVPFDCLRNCTLPTINLLNHFGANGNLRRFIYAGSSEAYASTVSRFGWKVPTDEKVPLCIDDPQNVRWSYGGSKLHGELATVAASKQFGIPYTIIRYHNVYGPRMGDKHVIPDFLRRAQTGVYELYGYQDTRSFIYVTDAVRATVMVANSESMKNEIVNIGSAEEITILALAEKILSLMGISHDITCHPSPKGSVSRRAPDLSKLSTLTGFKQQVSLDQGLMETIRYYLS